MYTTLLAPASAETCSCGTRHRSWFTAARCRWKGALWISGNPPRHGPCWATVSRCRHPGHRGPQVTVMLHPTLSRAEDALEIIRRIGCGGWCSRDHELIEMRAER